MKNERKRVETGQQNYKVPRTLGAFHSTKNSEILETGANGTEIFAGKVSRKSGNCWISKKKTIRLKIPEIPGAKLNGTEIPGKK